jgi:integrase
LFSLPINNGFAWSWHSALQRLRRNLQSATALSKKRPKQLLPSLRPNCGCAARAGPPSAKSGGLTSQFGSTTQNESKERKVVMAIYKRGRVYWYNFVFDNQHIQGSTKQGNPRVARQIEAAHKTRLAKGEVGLAERRQVPTLREFAPRFQAEIEVHCCGKPRTIAFWKQKLTRLLEFAPMAAARLDKIDRALISTYVQSRHGNVAIATINRELATLRRILYLAHDWNEIPAVPRIKMLKGERSREFVFSREQEKLYLSKAPQPLRDVASLLFETGLRLGEALVLKWTDIELDAANGKKLGYLFVREGKSKNARRHVSLTPRAQAILVNRSLESKSEYVFANQRGEPYLVTSLDHLHNKLRDTLGLPKDCVIHSMRHTFLTRFGEAGADAFTIKKVAGHSSVTVSERYIHPTPEGQERAFQRFANMNQTATEKAENDAGSLQVPLHPISGSCKSLCPCSSTVRAADS